MGLGLIDLALYLQRTYEQAIAGAIMTLGDEVVIKLLANGWCPELDNEVKRLWKMAGALPKNNQMLDKMVTAICYAGCLKDVIDWWYAYEHVVPLDVQCHGASAGTDWLLNETKELKHFINHCQVILDRLEDLDDERQAYSREGYV